jgi:hypothetical protein
VLVLHYFLRGVVAAWMRSGVGQAVAGCPHQFFNRVVYRLVRNNVVPLGPHPFFVIATWPPSSFKSNSMEPQA